MSRILIFSFKKLSFYLFASLVCFAYFSNAAALSDEKIKSLAAKLNKQIAASRVSSDDVGAAVTLVSPDKSQMIFEHQAEKKFIPASVTKIIPAAAALKILGPSHKFTTALLTTAPVKDRVLKGDIYLKGGGDPAFVTETLWVLVNELHRGGIRKVEGSIIVDDSLFDEVRFDPSRNDSRVDRAYDAPVGAMSFNWNSVNVYVRPGLKVGELAEVHADPENELVFVDNKVKTVAANKRDRISVRRISMGQGKEKLIVTGTIGISSEEKVFYKNVTHPALWSGANLKSSMALRGIDVTGKIKRGKTPELARTVADVESKALSQIVQDMMKFSNNYVAEMLTKHLALAKGSSQGDMKAGMDVLRTYVSSTGVSREDFVLENPSGLTYNNRFRPADIIQILSIIQNDFLVRPEALASLPLSGLDGTMKSRLKKYPGRVRAKTGLLNGVIGLAGWVDSSAGPLAFSFFFNGNANRGGSAKDLFDQLLITLMEWE